MRSSLRRVKDGPKRAANLPVDEDLLAQAKELQVEASQAAEAGLAHAIAEKRAEIWLRDNKEALESSNRYVETQGLPLGRHRQF
ncbi:type II toxin-antitoxin system CcdA family antitoxin [Azospirillum sp. SYSU D00513]|uniref:type II toxin-antitoxin system CcdA family antitoxin n=1 Tax=Azospirillum sp. SYSU D00513 TaxID=2812561 RepID=UPI001A97B38F|nr:type II toxin-antitoxin system CcdA family antitoxin [Azospirillum sp. SYSU D00513]